jgi:hypothetical protein
VAQGLTPAQSFAVVTKAESEGLDTLVWD